MVRRGIQGGYTRIQRYRIPDDALIRILEFFDPRSLFLASKVFKRVYALAMTYHTLRYTIELALAGMRDGPTSLQLAPILGRLHLLSSYRVDWPLLNWTHEYKIQAPATSIITELPSCRTGRTPALTRRQRFTSPPVESVCVDPVQGLIIGVHIFGTASSVCRCTFAIYGSSANTPKPQQNHTSFPTQSTVPVSSAELAIQGNKMALTLEFANGKKSHLIMDWRSLGARWIDDQDILMLDEDLLLVVSKRPAVMTLFSITHLAHMGAIRQYELPPQWVASNHVINLHANAASRSPIPGSLFFPDPANRIVVIEGISKTRSSTSWLFIQESYFRRRRDPPVVGWGVWGLHCAIKEFKNKHKVGAPYPVGGRVVYLVGAATLNVIEFASFPENPPRLDASWSALGSGLFPSETARRLPLGTVEQYAVDDLGVTEDNVVLFLEPQADFRPLNVLTFGAPKIN
ncbi:F-box domain-containing protein [Mycena chlorophos]|uniref:F-box domain-containing protein n=1 Tax=Mycena chlorophos TaxID=658473 RepID=A0A8H6T2V5_MYCCL|nr:F-box domain-containing protein [Mycena chlorophos]